MANVKLRDYQQDAVNATLKHFKQSDEAAVIVLPTGAGKSLIIAELARLAKGRILVLTHVKELVEQNHEKYQNLGLTAGIYSAGLKQKQTQLQVTFASIQSAARNLTDFKQTYSLVIIDECHRIAPAKQNDNTAPLKHNQYHLLLAQLKSVNPKLKQLGLTATPYRMGLGWIYQYHYYGIKRSDTQTPFVKCIYELPISFLIKKGFLTPPKQVNAAIEEYDFSELSSNNQGQYSTADLNEIVTKHPRVTAGICQHIQTLALERKGVMIFAASVEHAKEIQGYFEQDKTALITGDTSNEQRQSFIQQFKAQKLKYLINVSVLTTGFDAPHVDFIAILRPTQSVGLYQQIVGRGLRLSLNKSNCLVIDYAGNGYDIFFPEVGATKPNSESVPVMVKCPLCNFANTFWGKLDDQKQVVEHFGRRCWGYEEFENPEQHIIRQACQYRFKFKHCPQCMSENDIAARQCHTCGEAIIDPDEQLRAALNLSHAMVLRCAGVSFDAISKTKLKVSYHDEEGTQLSEFFELKHPKARQRFNQLFGKRFNGSVTPKQFEECKTIVALVSGFTAPDFVIAYKDKRAKNKQQTPWVIKERLFDYQGKYRKANQL